MNFSNVNSNLFILVCKLSILRQIRAFNKVPCILILLSLWLNLFPQFCCAQTPPGFEDAVWRGVGNSGASGPVYALTLDASTNVYIGGYFVNVGGMDAHFIGEFDGSSWLGIGQGANMDQVYALATSGTNLYAGGHGNLVKWNGTNWSALGSSFLGSVRAIAIDGTNLYIGGSFNANQWRLGTT